MANNTFISVQHWSHRSQINWQRKKITLKWKENWRKEVCEFHGKFYFRIAFIPCKAKPLKLCVSWKMQSCGLNLAYFPRALQFTDIGRKHIIFTLKQIYIMEQNAKFTWIFKIKQMTSKKFQTSSRFLGARIQSPLPLGVLGWERLMQHRLRS